MAFPAECFMNKLDEDAGGLFIKFIETADLGGRANADGRIMTFKYFNGTK